MDVDAGANIWRFNGSARYFKVSENAAGIEDEGLVWAGQFKFTENWSAVVTQTRNITERQDIRMSLGIAYRDECSFFQLAYERSGARDRTLGPSESIRFLFVLTGLGGVWGLVLAIGLFFVCFGLTAANGTTLALQPHPTIAGAAASALGFSQTVVPSLIASGVALLYDGTAVPMLVAILLLFAICWVVSLSGTSPQSAS